ncbi:MAG: LCP family protein, partial [Alicyclobacillus sp.]|nr:LCP family protein [Alicyclobacillus sp.]
FNVVLIGSDQRPEDKAGHSDSILLVHVDLEHQQFNVLSVPRDMRVYMPGHGYTKLTSVQYIAQLEKGTVPGIEEAVAAVAQATGIPINYYAETNYSGFREIVDAVGGIQLNVPFDVRLTHPWYPEDRGMVIRKGPHLLNGKLATELVHERYSLPDGDFSRQQLQEQALQAIARQLLKPGSLVRLPNFVQALPKFLIATNLAPADVFSLALAAYGTDLNHDLHYYQVDGQFQTMYDDILQQSNDQFVPDSSQLQQVASAYFSLGAP